MFIGNFGNPTVSNALRRQYIRGTVQTSGPKYPLVLFDFDGTLADSFPWFLSVINRVAQRYRFRQIAPDEIERLRGLGSREIVRHLGIAWWKMPFVARHLRGLAHHESSGIRLFEGVPDMLSELSASGVRLGIVTSNSLRKVESVLGPAATLIHYFGCDVGLFAKPRALRRALNQTGMEAAHTLYVGDEIRDAEAAQAVGIAFAAVGWGYTKPEALSAQHPRHLLQRVDQIADCVLREKDGP